VPYAPDPENKKKKEMPASLFLADLRGLGVVGQKTGVRCSRSAITPAPLRFGAIEDYEKAGVGYLFTAIVKIPFGSGHGLLSDNSDKGERDDCEDGVGIDLHIISP